MQRLWLTGRVLPAGARLTVQHVFRSAESGPLEVIYSFPLPRDAALRAFRISGDGFESRSELRRTEDAVQAYERGLADGSLSALARQYGDGVVNLTLGNIRPNETVTVCLDLLAGVELRDDGFRFRFPFTLAPTYHPRMKAAVAAPGEGEIELPPDQFGDVILPRFREDSSSLHEVGFDLAVLHQLPIQELGSPSHSIRVRQDGTAPARVTLATEKDVPNRDLVLDVRYPSAAAQVFAGPAGEAKRVFAAILPSTSFGANPETPRRVVVLLDRSGSMHGAPLEQARKAIQACLATLSPNDSFHLVAFDDQCERMCQDMHPLPATRTNRDLAAAFLSKVDARGGTELAQGFRHAADILGRSGDVLILTDGQVAGAEEILAQARDLNIRLSCLGIGSASQDRFLSLLARETGGVSRFVTPRERVDLAAVDLFASLGRPIASGLKTSNDVQPEPPSSVFAGTPVLLFGEAELEAGPLELNWDGGRLSLPIPAGDHETGQTVRLLQGSRLITDWESRYPAEEALAPIEKRREGRVASRLLALSQAYGLASREMSLVAVVKRAGDRPGELPVTRVVPVGLPQDVSFGAYFAGQLSIAPAGAPAACCAPRSPVNALFGPMDKVHARQPEEPLSDDDLLLDLASQLEPDGGMPGRDDSERAARSVAAVLAFVAAGHTLSTGAFRSHLARLVAFLKSVRGLSVQEQALVDSALEAASTGRALTGDWLAIARARRVPWASLSAAGSGK
jgi:Ca-activated chloride channel family protein